MLTNLAKGGQSHPGRERTLCKSFFRHSTLVDQVRYYSYKIYSTLIASICKQPVIYTVDDPVGLGCELKVSQKAT
jgi:hypothetical protein